MTRLLFPVLVATLVAVGSLLGGCSSTTEPWPTATGTSNRHESSQASKKNLATLHEVKPATESAEPLATRAIRPVPDVISKPRLFELPSSVIKSLPPIEAVSIDPIEFPSAEPPTVVEIRGMMRDYLAAINTRDAASLAAHWSESGESVDLDSGERTQGRDSIRRVFATLFERDADASVAIDVTAVRPIRDEVAVVDGISKLTCPDDKPARSRFSAVVVKHDGRWLLESVRESRLPESGEKATDSPLGQLAWLVGHWDSVADEAVASTHCFWSAREAYLVRSHTVAAKDDEKYADRVVSFEEPQKLEASRSGREITEIVGWDPVARSLRSWIFSSDGGFGEGFWTTEGDHVRVRIDGTLADGSPVSGTVTITRIGPDEVSCAIAGDRIESLVPPGGDFLRTARASDGR